MVCAQRKTRRTANLLQRVSWSDPLPGQMPVDFEFRDMLICSYDRASDA